jgi:hypothetical protein
VHKRWAIAIWLTGLMIVLAATPSSATASAYSQVLRAYQVSGSVPPCRFSSAQLAAALRSIDTYGQQYFADFSNAVQSALAARAAGACTPGAHPRVSSSPAPQAPLPPSATSATDANLPLPMLVLGGLTAVLSLAVGAAAATRSVGWEPGWAAAWRHAWGEAGYRMSGRAADLADRWRRR